MTALDLSQFDQRWAERRIRGKHCPNWVAHYRIYSVRNYRDTGWFWCVLQPGQLEGTTEPNCAEFATFQEARAHVAHRVDAHRRATVQLGGREPAWVKQLAENGAPRPGDGPFIEYRDPDSVPIYPQWHITAPGVPYVDQIEKVTLVESESCPHGSSSGGLAPGGVWRCDECGAVTE